VRVDGILAARERYILEPGRPETLAALNRKFPQGHYLGCFWITEKPFPVEAVEALEQADGGIYLGWTALCRGGWSIKILGADALTTRRTLSRLRRILYAAMERVPPALGRF
ncbi:MAG: Urease accessory protein UreD, partial [Verrucomicrobiales bacterium]|nr:Urease accessory protein UreD [Verrucomicrobiales bacterium]